MEAIILAGGFGTRLKTVVPKLPKPMAPINHRPFLTFLLDYLNAQGFTHVIFSVYHRHEIIQNFFKSTFKNIAIRYVIDPEPLNTGGAIKHALPHAHEKNVFIINGDTFVELNYSKMHELHANATLSIALHHQPIRHRYGQIALAGNRIISFGEKGPASEPGLINAGVYLMNREKCLPFMKETIFSFEQDFLSRYVPELNPKAFITEGYFVDIGIPEDYTKFQQEAAHVFSSY